MTVRALHVGRHSRAPKLTGRPGLARGRWPAGAIPDVAGGRYKYTECPSVMKKTLLLALRVRARNRRGSAIGARWLRRCVTHGAHAGLSRLLFDVAHAHSTVAPTSRRPARPAGTCRRRRRCRTFSSACTRSTPRRVVRKPSRFSSRSCSAGIFYDELCNPAPKRCASCRRHWCL